jgi:hypothetical protein
MLLSSSLLCDSVETGGGTIVDFRLTERNIVLIAHVLAAIITIGPTTMAASIFPRSVLDGDWQVARAMHRITHRYGKANLLVLVFGLWLAWRFEWFEYAWVSWALGLFILAGIVLVGLVEPEQKRLLAREADAPLAKGDVAKARMWSGIYGVLWVIVLYLMIAKPS